MSWLSDLFGGGGGGQSSTDRLWQIYFQQQEQARQDAIAASQQQQQLDYLNTLRADEAAKQAKIEAADPTATRTAAMGSLGTVFAPEYATTLLPSTLTDPLEQAVYGEQRSKADEYVNRLFKRGILTDTGRAAAEAELERQAPGVRSQLDKIGQTLLESERGKLGDIEGRAKEAASTLGVGQPFDIAPYGTALSKEVGTFSGGLSDAYRAGIPTDLFDVTTLGAIGGGAQGAGNQPFDPAALAGAKTDETDPFATPTKKRVASVF